MGKGRHFLKFSLTCILIGFTTLSWGQVDSLSVILANPTNHGIQFKAKLPPLTTIPGGREAYYSYFWDFGDGHFSRAEHPVHAYAQPGNYDVKLYATNNYDKGTKPPRPVKSISVQYASAGATPDISTDEQVFLSGKAVFKLGKNTNAQPGTDIVLISGVNLKAPKGKIYILSNEKLYDNPGFAYAGQTTYYQEEKLPVLAQGQQAFYASTSINSAMITHSGSPNYGKPEFKTFKPDESVAYFKTLYDSYQSVTSYEVSGKVGEEQFSYVHINVLPEMLKDTNAIVTLTGIYVPDGSSKAYIHRLDIPIVASHDPNRMSVKQTRLNYRTASRGERLTYKVQFQNNGKGDAKNIRLEMTLPKVMDRESFKVLSIYPRIPECADSTGTGCWRKEAIGQDSLFVYFQGISLPGSKADREVPYDSTQGYVRFSIKADKRLPNKPFRGKTAIFFDKNKAVKTNWATGKFRKSLSPILFLGYHFITDENESVTFRDSLVITAGGPDLIDRELTYKTKNYFDIGVGIAPLAPYKKWFWQAELRLGYYEQEAGIWGIDTQNEIQIGGQYYSVSRYDKTYSRKNLRLQLALLPVKYNFNSWLSLGAGIEGNINFTIDAKEKLTVYTFANEQKEAISESDQSKTPVHWRAFADLNVGRVYLGPSVGVRYYFGLDDLSSLNVYLAWRF